MEVELPPQAKAVTAEPAEAGHPSGSCWSAAFHIDFGTGLNAPERYQQHLASSDLLEWDQGVTYLVPNVCNVTHASIRDSYIRVGIEDPVYVNKVILVMKTALSLLFYGMPAVDVEESVCETCALLDLPKPVQITASQATLTMSFDVSIVHVLPCARGIDLDKLEQTSHLSTRVLVGSMSVETTSAAIRTLHDLHAQSPPYGWFIVMLWDYARCVLAVVCAFLGDYDDMYSVALISPPVIVTAAVCRHYRNIFGNTGQIMVPLVTGVFTALVQRDINTRANICHIPGQYLSVLLIHLPGSDLLYGAYEAYNSSVLNGSVRVVNGVLRAMLIGISLTIGWQFTGHNLVTSYNGKSYIGAQASAVPFCALASDFKDVPYTWYEAFGGW